MTSGVNIIINNNIDNKYYTFLFGSVIFFFYGNGVYGYAQYNFILNVQHISYKYTIYSTIVFIINGGPSYLLRLKM